MRACSRWTPARPGCAPAAVFADGRPSIASYQEFTQHFPQPGWVEHDAVEIWTTARDTLLDVITRLPVAPTAIGITNQRETVVAWSRETGQPLHRVIVWQDRRTAARCDELTAQGRLPMVRERTGLVLDPYFSGTKFEWLLREGGVPLSDDLALGTIDTWLLWNLTGGDVHATDPSNASRTMLYDIRELRWSNELCAMLNVPTGALPTVMPSSGRFGITSDRCGVPAGIPISGIAGDQQSALFGQACFAPGHGQEHLWHGKLSAAQHRLDVPTTDRRHAHDRGVDARRRHHRLRARGARYSSRAQLCNGCATGCRSSRTRATSSLSPPL